MSNKLPNDYTLCVNHECHLKEQCKRWLTCKYDVDGVYSMALFRPIGTECENRIPAMFIEQDRLIQNVAVTERQKKLIELASRYHELTEAYDRTVCTGPIVNGSIEAMSAIESALCSRNAQMVLRDIQRQAAAHEIDAEELQRAIHDHK